MLSGLARKIFVICKIGNESMRKLLTFSGPGINMNRRRRIKRSCLERCVIILRFTDDFRPKLEGHIERFCQMASKEANILRYRQGGAMHRFRSLLCTKMKSPTLGLEAVAARYRQQRPAEKPTEAVFTRRPTSVCATQQRCLSLHNARVSALIRIKVASVYS